MQALLSLCLITAVSSLVNSEEACYSFGGGHVYPQESTKLSSGGHSLVWSKAQSKGIVSLNLFFSFFTY